MAVIKISFFANCNRTVRKLCCRNIYCSNKLFLKSEVYPLKCNKKSSSDYIRNIGILAHIDAGKTTTTERMLYYSGVISNMGEVHRGNTVTDFMEQERQRGITITAASVTFPWGDYTINLIDTPGHIDFTMEVEQTLSVMDGAVVVLDASAGVEAQTMTVWRQANRFNIPRVIYINKMDRPDAGFFSSLDAIKNSLHRIPLPLQLPFIQGNSFAGIVDIIKLQLKIWDETSLGTEVIERALCKSDGQLWADAISARQKLTDTLADIDDDLAEHIITHEVSTESVSEQRLIHAIRKVTHHKQGFPVVCGSSYKNIGVQALMDAVTMYLPPCQSCSKTSLFANCGSQLIAKAFKVRHDAHKGPLTFIRIFSGALKKNQKVYNLRLDGSDLASKIFVATADEYKDVDEIREGGIVAVSGLKRTQSGDLLTSSASSASSLKNRLSPEALEELNSVIPEPVFFCSIECPSQAQQAQLEKALNELSREDPSLRVRVDDETGQTVLSGMGELHLDVIKERIRREYRIQVDLGPLQISYKELLLQTAKYTHSVDLQVGSSRNTVKITLSVEPCDSPPNDIRLDRSQENAANLSSIFPKHLLALKSGALTALNRGPKLTCPVVNVTIILHWLEVTRGTTESVISSAANQCVKKLLAMGGTQLMEPIMLVDVACPGDHMPSVIADLNRRRAIIDKFSSKGRDKMVCAYVPLAELLGYATHLRTLTSGQASFSMQLHAIKKMSPFEESKAIKAVTGLDPL